MLDVAPGLNHESGEQLPSSWRPSRVALLAHWSLDPVVSLSVSSLVGQLREQGYDVVVVSASEARGALQWRPEYLSPTAVYRRSNVGYDFGSWAAGLAAFPGIARAERALLVNDSMLGPFTSIKPIVTSFESSASAVWGLVDSTQRGYHVQSHFVGYQDGCLAEPPLASFWRDIRVESDKQDIIDNYEIGLGTLIAAAQLGTSVCFPSALVVAEGDNPTIQGWRRLLLHGFPFVKREILLRPHEVLQDGDHVYDVVRTMFNTDVRGWL